MVNRPHKVQTHRNHHLQCELQSMHLHGLILSLTKAIAVCCGNVRFCMLALGWEVQEQPMLPSL